MSTRCGIVAIIGEPNAGKSTLINQLVGGKISIVTPKVQTTRTNLRGVCNYTTPEGNDTQFIFIDTPGIFEASKPFEKAMVNAAWSGAKDADAALLLIDAQVGLRDGARRMIDTLRDAAIAPLFLAINKIDLVEKPALMQLAGQCNAYGIFSRIFMIAARHNDGVDDIKRHLAAHMPGGPFLYPDDQLSDAPMRLIAAEITREKLFLGLDQELPYALFVETETWEENDRLINIAQAIYVQREGQKKIVLGEKGSKIKRIGIAARKDLEAMTGKKVNIRLFVKVRPHWKNDPESYRIIGLPQQ